MTNLARILWDKWVQRVPLARSLGLEVVHLTQTNLAFKDGEFGPLGIPNFQKINYMCPDFNGINPKFPEGRGGAAGFAEMVLRPHAVHRAGELLPDFRLGWGRLQ